MRGGINLYAYVSNKSPNRVDPLGLTGWIEDPDSPPLFYNNVGWQPVTWSPIVTMSENGIKVIDAVNATYTAQIYVVCLCPQSGKLQAEDGAKTLSKTVNLTTPVFASAPSTLVLGVGDSVADLPISGIAEGVGKMAAGGASNLGGAAYKSFDLAGNAAAILGDIKANAPKYPTDGAWVGGEPCSKL